MARSCRSRSTRRHRPREPHRRVAGSGEGGLVLRFYAEPHFSYARDGVIYGAASGGSLRTVDQYDFATGAYTRLLDLDTIAPGPRRGRMSAGSDRVPGRPSAS
jgi:hypothetical protein